MPIFHLFVRLIATENLQYGWILIYKAPEWSICFEVEKLASHESDFEETKVILQARSHSLHGAPLCRNQQDLIARVCPRALGMIWPQERWIHTEPPHPKRHFEALSGSLSAIWRTLTDDRCWESVGFSPASKTDWTASWEMKWDWVKPFNLSVSCLHFFTTKTSVLPCTLPVQQTV